MKKNSDTAIKPWLKEIKYYYLDNMFIDEYEEWRSEIKEEKLEEFNILNQSFIDSDNEEINFDYYENEMQTDLIKKSSYEITQYIEDILELRHIRNINWENYGFKND